MLWRLIEPLVQGLRIVSHGIPPLQQHNIPQEEGNSQGHRAELSNNSHFSVPTSLWRKSFLLFHCGASFEGGDPYLNSLHCAGTPRPFFATLRRQLNFTEKGVNPAISCAEQRPFKIPQLPALRAVVMGPAQQKRRFFLLQRAKTRSFRCASLSPLSLWDISP